MPVKVNSVSEFSNNCRPYIDVYIYVFVNRRICMCIYIYIYRDMHM